MATGAGKTYAAYMGPLAELIDEVRTSAVPVRGLRILYITPLRAVSRDIELALKEPIADLGLAVRVESRTGDTSASLRAKQKDELPQVLITTPESLTLLLTREHASAMFRDLRGVIVDEWHELLSTKRGTQVELALARLRRFAPRVRTWALSATLPNVEEAARAVVGAGSPEPTIIRADMPRPVRIDSVLPREGSRLPWAGHLGLTMLREVAAAIDPTVSTLVFTNTRSQAERWFHALLVEKPEWADFSALHHGSIDRGERERVERGLKDGSIRLVVATSSLDLGVDFTPVERVFQIGSPKGIARLVQRAGRSSHRPKAPCRITCVPTHMLELVEIAAARRALSRGQIESRTPFEKPLDVLVQHLVTCALGGGFEARELYDEVRTAWSYRELTWQEFEWSLALVEHGGGTLSAYPQYHRVARVDPSFRVPDARHAQLHRLNVGTITGDTTIQIAYVHGRSLGRIEEGFVSGLREGQKFVFAGKTLEFVMLRDLVAYVRPSRGKTTYTPIWSGTRLPISESLAAGIRETLESCAGGVLDTPELEAAGTLVEVQTRESVVPRHDETLAEVVRTREGTHLFLFPFDGRLVHAGLATLLALRLARRRKGTFSIAANDYGLEILSAEEYPFEEMLREESGDDGALGTPAAHPLPPPSRKGLFGRQGLVDDILESMNVSQMARLQFREVARISGLVFQNYPGSPKSGRQVQASSGLIFDVLSEFDPENLLLRQARREVLERHFESGRFARVLDRIAASALRIVTPCRPTPLSFPLLIERQAATLSNQSVVERVEAMRRSWEGGGSSEVVVVSKSGAGGKKRQEMKVRASGVMRAEK